MRSVVFALTAILSVISLITPTLAYELARRDVYAYKLPRQFNEGQVSITKALYGYQPGRQFVELNGFPDTPLTGMTFIVTDGKGTSLLRMSLDGLALGPDGFLLFQDSNMTFYPPPAPGTPIVEIPTVPAEGTHIFLLVANMLAEIPAVLTNVTIDTLRVISAVSVQGQDEGAVYEKGVVILAPHDRDVDPIGYHHQPNLGDMAVLSLNKFEYNGPFTIRKAYFNGQYTTRNTNNTVTYNPGNTGTAPSCGGGTVANPSNGACLVCDSSCAGGCTGPTRGECNSCANGQSNGVCTCADGYYAKGAYCVSCDPTCLTCSGPGPKNCLTCSGTCPTNPPLYTSGCDVRCSECSNTGDGDACSKCAYLPTLAELNIFDKYLGASVSACACPAGYFEDMGSCIACPVGCATCIANPFQLSNLNQTSGNGASNATGNSTKQALCMSCSSSMKKLWGIEHETNKPGSFSQMISPFSDVGYCSTCPTGFYPQGTQCISCDISCDQAKGCSGAGPTACMTCVGGSNVTNNAACACSDGSYFDTSLSSCMKCNSKCQTCNGPSEKDCLTCFSGTLPCTTCPDGTYLSPDGSCAPCDGSCAVCTGPTNKQCSTCTAGDPTNGVCPCKIGFYASNNLCLPCAEGCFECTGPSTADCTDCALGSNPDTYSQPTCTANPIKGAYTNCGCTNTLGLYCAVGFYMLGTSCYPCADNCFSCTGPSSYECTSCGTKSKNSGMEIIGTPAICPGMAPQVTSVEQVKTRMTAIKLLITGLGFGTPGQTHLTARVGQYPCTQINHLSSTQLTCFVSGFGSSQEVVVTVDGVSSQTTAANLGAGNSVVRFDFADAAVPGFGCSAPSGSADSANPEYCNCWSGYAPTVSDFGNCAAFAVCPGQTLSASSVSVASPKAPIVKFKGDTLTVTLVSPIVHNRRDINIQFAAPLLQYKTPNVPAGTLGSITCAYPGPIWKKTVDSLDCSDIYTATFPWSQHGLCGFVEDTNPAFANPIAPALPKRVFKAMLVASYNEMITKPKGGSSNRKTTANFVVAVSFATKLTVVTQASISVTAPDATVNLAVLVTSTVLYNPTNSLSTVTLESTIAYPYQIAPSVVPGVWTKDLTSTEPAGTQISASVVVTSSPDCSTVVGSDCGQVLTLSIDTNPSSSSQRVCDLFGKIDFPTTALQCRDSGAVGACGTGYATSTTFTVTFGHTNLCEAAAIDGAKGTAGALMAYHDSGFTTAASSFELGEPAYFEIVVSDPISTIDQLTINQVTFDTSPTSGTPQSLYKVAQPGDLPSAGTTTVNTNVKFAVIRENRQVSSDDFSNSLAPNTNASIRFSFVIDRANLVAISSIAPGTPQNVLISVTLDVVFHGNNKKRAVATFDTLSSSYSLTLFDNADQEEIENEQEDLQETAAWDTLWDSAAAPTIAVAGSVALFVASFALFL